MGVSTKCISLWIAIFLTGCAADRSEVNWPHGTKRAVVTQVYSADTPREDLPPCVAKLPASELALHRFAQVEYRHVRHLFREVGELPAGSSVQVGDQIELYPKDCDNKILSIITRVLPKIPP